MAEQQNPFELEQPQQTRAGMTQMVPQPGGGGEPLYGGLQPGEGGSYFTLSPEAMQMMWAPQQPPMLGLAQPPM